MAMFEDAEKQRHFERVGRRTVLAMAAAFIITFPAASFLHVDLNLAFLVWLGCGVILMVPFLRLYADGQREYDRAQHLPKKG